MKFLATVTGQPFIAREHYYLLPYAQRVKWDYWLLFRRCAERRFAPAGGSNFNIRV